MIQFGIELLIFSEIIPLTNLFSQSKMKGMDQIFFTLSVQAINQSKKRQGSVTYSTDCENKLSKIHVMSLGFNRG